MTSLREAAVAGQFYPGTAAELDATVRRFLDQAGKAQDQVGRTPKAIIAPHAGYVYSGAIAATAYALLTPAAAVITRVVLLGPCHRVPVRGLALSGADAFRTPLGDVALDKAAAAEISGLAGVEVFDAAHEMEHSLEVHLPFLQVVLDDFAVVPLVVGEAGAAQVADVMEALWGGPETLFVVSTDLSHYLDYDGARRLDAATCQAIEALDPGAISRNGACGRFPVGGLLELAKRRGMTVTTLDIRNSGDTAGSKDRVVGYGSWMFLEKPPKRTAKVTWNNKEPSTGGIAAEDSFAAATQALLARHGETLLKLAARSIVCGLKQGRALPTAVDGYPAELAAPGACFVTIKRDGRLRGCIGTSEAHRPLVVDVADNAFKASFKDPRFGALKEAEVAGIALSISAKGAIRSAANLRVASRNAW